MEESVLADNFDISRLLKLQPPDPSPYSIVNDIVERDILFLSSPLEDDQSSPSSVRNVILWYESF